MNPIIHETNLKVLASGTESYRLILRDGMGTTVHVARYPRANTVPRVVLFDRETCLKDWCREHDIDNAMSGGFFLREILRPRGDIWIDGKKQETVASISPWNIKRGCLYVNEEGEAQIAPRYLLPQRPRTDLLEAGPLLLQNGRSLIKEDHNAEGFREGYLAGQNDDDITLGRFPRAAIGYDKRFIYSVACDGYGKGEAGLTLKEFADFLVGIGLIDALNMDGGSSATVVFGGRIINRPKGGKHAKYAIFEHGRPIFSAVVFEAV